LPCATGDRAFVPVAQDFDLATGVGDRFAVMKRGAVTLSGTKDTPTREELRQAARAQASG
jgi:urea transport system ATP-binding protein